MRSTCRMPWLMLIPSSINNQQSLSARLSGLCSTSCSGQIRHILRASAMLHCGPYTSFMGISPNGCDVNCMQGFAIISPTYIPKVFEPFFNVLTTQSTSFSYQIPSTTFMRSLLDGSPQVMYWPTVVRNSCTQFGEYFWMTSFFMCMSMELSSSARMVSFGASTLAYSRILWTILRSKSLCNITTHLVFVIFLRVLLATIYNGDKCPCP